MATTLTYGPITLQNVLTKKFEQEAVYDESGTDLLYHKFTVRVVGYVHRHALTPNMPDAVAIEPRSLVSPTSDYLDIRALLLEPRWNLALTVGGTNLLYVIGATANPQQFAAAQNSRDLNNGPKPRFCEVTRIAGTSLLQVEFEIEACILECRNDLNYSNVLSNRFSVADSIDEDWYTTRTYRGRIRFKSLYPNAHNFRHWVIPPLQRGFKRQQVEVAASVDGLSLDYVVTDKEIYAACPFPGTTWEATQTVTTGEHAVQTISELVVSVKGPRTVAKRDLIATCAIITLTRLDLNAQRSLNYILLGASVVDYLHENRVEMRARVQEISNLDADGQPLRQLSIAVGRLGKPLDFSRNGIPDVYKNYDPELSPVPPLYGTATWTGLFICALQSPCDTEHGMPQLIDKPPEKADEKPSGGLGNVFEYPPGTALDGLGDSEVTNNISAETREAMYAHYKIDVEYAATSMRVALPIASPPATANDPTCAVVQLGRPQARATVRVEAERIGQWPTMPATIDYVDVNGIPWYFDRDRVISKTPTLMADRKMRVYSIDQEFHYILARPLAAGESLSTGKLPFDTFTVQQNLLPASKFSLKWA